MVTDKIRKYVLPNIPYLFIGWFCLKIGTAYRLAAGTGFGEKLLGLGQTIGAAFADFAPGLDRKSTRLNSSHSQQSRMPSSA